MVIAACPRNDSLPRKIIHSHRAVNSIKQYFSHELTNQDYIQCKQTLLHIILEENDSVLVEQVNSTIGVNYTSSGFT